MDLLTAFELKPAEDGKGTKEADKGERLESRYIRPKGRRQERGSLGLALPARAVKDTVELFSLLAFPGLDKEYFKTRSGQYATARSAALRTAVPR